MSDFKALVAEMKKSAADVRSKIKALDAEIEELNEERQAINAAPVSKADFMEYLRSDIQRRAARMPQLLQQTFAQREKSRNFEILERIDSRGGKQDVPYINGDSPVDHVTLGDHAFFWYFGDLIAERFEQVADGLSWPADAMPVAQRRQRIKEIDSKIGSLSAQRNMLEMDLRSVVV
jgi:septal ring factor EnvC (AmiA/AmiB activator)